MNDADLDIILGITNGRLTGQQKQDALDLIAADPELSEELAIQVSAMDEFGALEPAHMTPSEKLTLRNSLVEHLHLASAVPVATTSKQSKTPFVKGDTAYFIMCYIMAILPETG